jgi:hypothetical protein
MRKLVNRKSICSDVRVRSSNNQSQQWTLTALKKREEDNALIWDAGLISNAGMHENVSFIFPTNPRKFLASLLQEQHGWHELKGILLTVGWAQLREMGVATQQQVGAAMRGLNPLCYVPADYPTRVRFCPDQPDPWDIEFLDGTIRSTRSLQCLHLLLWTSPHETGQSEFAR